MTKLEASPRAVTAAQLVGVWAVGSLGLTASIGFVAVAFFGAFAVLAGALCVLGVLYVYLLGVVTLTRDVSRLSDSGPARALWAAMVLGVGLAGWVLSWGISSRAGLRHNLLLIVLLGGVPFVLVAGALLRDRRANGIAVGLSLALVAGGLLALRQSGPDEVTERLQGYPRDTVYVASIPGYHPTQRPYGDRLGAGDFEPDNPSLIPPERFITVVAYGPQELGPVEGACGRVARDSRLSVLTDCTADPDGLVFHEGKIAHGYQVQRGDVFVAIVGTPAVARALLHRLATTVHLATVRELGGHTEQNGTYYVGDAPGYTGAEMGIPPGMRYELTNHASGVQGVFIRVQAEYGDATVNCSDAVCEAERDGLTYRRHGNGFQSYVIRHGYVNISVTAGALVDRDLIRRVAFDARPATDEEIIRGLLPPKPTGFLGRLRQWLRDHI